MVTGRRGRPSSLKQATTRQREGRHANSKNGCAGRGAGQWKAVFLLRFGIWDRPSFAKATKGRLAIPGRSAERQTAPGEQFLEDSKTPRPARLSTRLKSGPDTAAKRL